MPLLFPLPSLPGFHVAPGHILTPGKPIGQREAECWFDCLIRDPYPKDGCNWVIQVNFKVYFIRWRDYAPKPPWTRQVWDVYQILPPCGKCPTLPRHLGWFWCWADLIKMIRSEVLRNWINEFQGVSGVTQLTIGGTQFQEASTNPLVRPTLWLDASDSDTITLSGPNAVEWLDKSTFGRDATQPIPASGPVLGPLVNGLQTLSFQPAFLETTLPRTGSWHLFVMGRFQPSVLSDRGTWFNASLDSDPFFGISAQVIQDGTPIGALTSWVGDTEYQSVDALQPPNSWGIMEFSQRVAPATPLFGDPVSEGEIRFGTLGYVETVFQGNTQTNQLSSPIAGMIGRSPWGIDPSRDYDDLFGEIGEVLLYPEVLTQAQRVQVLNYFRSKWGLGAPLSP